MKAHDHRPAPGTPGTRPHPDAPRYKWIMPLPAPSSSSVPPLTPRHLVCVLHGASARRCPCTKVRLTTRLRRIHEIDDQAQAIFDPSPFAPTTGPAGTPNLLSFPSRLHRPMRPLVFDDLAYDVFTIQTAWNVRRTGEYHCLLYGERTPHALIVKAIIDDTLAPKDRDLFLTEITREGYVLLGQAHDYAEDYLANEERPDGYVYLVTTNIDGIDVTTCQSTTADGTVTTHPVAVIDEKGDPW